MATFTGLNDGYGAAEFTVHNGLSVPAWWDAVRVDVNPEQLKVTITHPGGKAYPRVGEWYGPDAVADGAAACNGRMPPAVLADFCEETPPVSACHDLHAGARLRKAQ